MKSLTLPLYVSIAAFLLLTLLSSPSTSLTSDSASASSSLFPTLLSVSAGPARKKLTEKELNEIEDQWMEDEEEDEDDLPFKFKKNADGHRIPPQPTTKTEMGFVTIKGTPGRKKTDEFASRWSDMMLAAGIDVRAYTIEDNRILFVCDQRGHKDMNKVRTFLLQQPETQEFEWNNKKSLPGEATGDDGADVKDPLAKFQAMQDEQANAAKRAARAEKKEKEKKKRQAEAKKKKLQQEKAKKEKAKKEAEKKAEAEKKKQQEQQQKAQEELKTEL